MALRVSDTELQGKFWSYFETGVPAGLAVRPPRKQMKEAKVEITFAGLGQTVASERPIGPRGFWHHKAEKVKEVFLEAWRSYSFFAWGADEYCPLTRAGSNLFGGIGLQIIDALSALHLMGFHDEFQRAREFVADLNFTQASRTRKVSVFELVIRGVGGLLSAFALSKDAIFATKARELADQIIAVFDTQSGIPASHVYLGSGQPAYDGHTVALLAEIGTLQLEFRYLSHVTQDPTYAKLADRAIAVVQLDAHGVINPTMGLKPTRYFLDRVPPRIEGFAKYGLAGESDSYYEYLAKSFLQDGSERFNRLQWLNAVKEVRDGYIKDGAIIERYVREVWHSPKAHLTRPAVVAHLACFFPGLVEAMQREFPEDPRYFDRKTLDGMTHNCVELYRKSKTGLAPEVAQLAPWRKEHGYSLLRPETLESLYYHHYYTGAESWRHAGLEIFASILRHGYIANRGFVSVDDVDRPDSARVCPMQTFVLAETLLYLYLLFSEKEALDLSKWVFNTEAHPLPRFDCMPYPGKECPT